MTDRPATDQVGRSPERVTRRRRSRLRRLDLLVTRLRRAGAHASIDVLIRDRPAPADIPLLDFCLKQSSGAASGSPQPEIFQRVTQSPSGDLARVIEAWPDLPEAIRDAVVAMVRATARSDD